MTILERLELRTGETNVDLLNDIIETAKNAILSRRFPYGDYPTREVTQTVSHTVTTTDEVTGETTTETTEQTVTTEETFVEDRYLDLQFRIALDLYNKQGAEGQETHSENGISRTFESSWISSQLLLEVVPKYIGMGAQQSEMSET